MRTLDFAWAAGFFDGEGSIVKKTQAEVAIAFQERRKSGQMNEYKRPLKLSQDVADQLRLREIRQCELV